MDWMILPTLACVVIVLTLGWFGLHVLERGVIFVDLALAQVAALGTTWAVFLGNEPDSNTAFAISLSFTFVGAIAFSSARLFEARVPQEAIIGIAYAVSAALGILLVHFADDPHGGEKIEHLLVGNLVWIQPGELAVLAGVCASVGVVHFLVRKSLLEITFQPEKARESGVNIALWDVMLYLTFGFALTAIVAFAGVLLVFSYLVIPAVIARLFFTGVGSRLGAAWAIGLVVSVLGVSVSYEHPIGPVIVGFFAVALVVALAGYAIKTSKTTGKTAVTAVVAFGGVAALLFGTTKLPKAEHHHEEEAVANVARVEAAPADDFTKLSESVTKVRSGDLTGLQELAALCAAEAPFIRMEADSRLRALADTGAPAYDPLSGPDTAGAWAAWATSQTAMPAGASEMAVP